MKAIKAIALLVVAAAGSNEYMRNIARAVNSQQKSWVATENPTMPLEHAKRLLGVRNMETLASDPNNPPLKTFTEAEILAAPASYDPRTEYPDCKSIREIRDQAECGSCWAVGAVSAMSDRICIHTGENVRLSAEDMLTCSGGGSCDGGYPSSAYSYYKRSGVVTEECRPYSFPSCDHHIENSTNPCVSDETGITPDCLEKCDNGVAYKNDKFFANKTYTVSGAANIRAELSSYGPCEAAFYVYEDFLTYKSGIYKHVTGNYMGGHAVKIMGYGEENGEKYWLLANSWNEKWGEKGYFRVAVGQVNIESTVYCGFPAIA